MSPGLLILVLLIPSVPLCTYAQSLGEVARETRAQEQKRLAPKVISNEDLAQPGTQESAQPTSAAAAKPSTPSNNKDWEARERNRQQRAEAINKQYRERIADLRDQIYRAEADVEKLQHEYIRIEVTETVTGEATTRVDGPFTIQQAMEFNQKLTDWLGAQRKVITELKAKLAELQEEARHAGAPHADE